MGCGASARSVAPYAVERRCAVEERLVLADDLSLACIAPGVWVYTALAGADFSLPRYPANGLVLESADHATLIDSAWSSAQTARLIDWSRSRGRPITAAIATHFHDDRVAGAPALRAARIPFYATAETIALARSHGAAVPDRALEPASVPEVRWLFPGAGHAPDNIVVWHAPTRTLFGGCLVKDLAATALGNLSDADVARWPAALDRVRATFGDPARVVPGHGAVGGTELLDHTRDLLAE